MQCIEGCLLYIPKYEIEAASGRFCRYQSMQEKLPVASSLHITSVYNTYTYNTKISEINE